MGTSFKKLYTNLLAWVDEVPPSFAKLITQQAIREIYDEHDWGFLLTNSYIRTPKMISTGTAAVTQFSDQVFLSAAAFALVDAITVDNVPIIERQFRTLSPISQTGQSFIYNITNYVRTIGTKAAGTLQISFPADGDIITLNGSQFRFKNVPVLPADVLIDGTFDNQITALNLLAKIATLAIPAVNLATFVSTGGGGINITYTINGLVGNAYTLVTSAPARLIISGATLLGGTDDTGVLTINPPFQDISSPAARYQILKVYYAPPWYIPIGGDPRIDFKGWEWVLSPLWQRRIHLDSTQEELNRFDSSRNWVDEPRHLVPYSFGFDNLGNEYPLFEMYPFPKEERVFRVQYERKGVIPQRDTEIVPFFNEELIIKKARMKAYEWLIGNSDKSTTVKTTGKYANLIAMLGNRNDPNSYPNLLQNAKDLDVEADNRTFLGDFVDGNLEESLYCPRGFGNKVIDNTLVLSF